MGVAEQVASRSSLPSRPRTLLFTHLPRRGIFSETHMQIIEWLCTPLVTVLATLLDRHAIPTQDVVCQHRYAVRPAPLILRQQGEHSHTTSALKTLALVMELSTL